MNSKRSLVNQANAALKDMATSLMAIKSMRKYQSDLRPVVRGYWNGTYDYYMFYTNMMEAISRGFTAAFSDGLRVVGIESSEMTSEERIILRRRISKETQYIDNLATFIEKNSRKNGGKLRTIYGRLGLWVNRYKELVNLGISLGRSNPKLKWVLGATEEHCVDCGKVAGRVYRAKIWSKHGWQPQSSDLSCRGYNCDCRFEVTNDPVTPGRPPKLSGGGI